MLLTFSRRTTGKGKTEGEPGKTARRCELWPRLSRAARPRCPRRLRASQGRQAARLRVQPTSPRVGSARMTHVAPASGTRAGRLEKENRIRRLSLGQQRQHDAQARSATSPSPLSGARLPKDGRSNHPDDRLLKGGGGCLGATVPDGSEHNSRCQCPHAHGWPGPPGPRTSDTWGPAGNTPQRAG